MTSKIITKTILAIATLSLSQSTSLHAQDNSGAQKEMPAKALEESYVNPSLRGTILHDDYDALVMCKEKALDILSTLGDSDYGIKNRKAVKKLLSQEEQEISLEDLHGHHRVRSIQVNNSGIFIYPFFACRFTEKDGKPFFEKTAGSQRKSGFIYANKPTSMIFLGGWSVNDEPQTEYGSLNSVAGTLYKINENKLIMLFVRPYRDFEIYEFTKQQADQPSHFHRLANSRAKGVTLPTKGNDSLCER